MSQEQRDFVDLDVFSHHQSASGSCLLAASLDNDVFVCANSTFRSVKPKKCPPSSQDTPAVVEPKCSPNPTPQNSANYLSKRHKKIVSGIAATDCAVQWQVTCRHPRSVMPVCGSGSRYRCSDRQPILSFQKKGLSHYSELKGVGVTAVTSTPFSKQATVNCCRIVP